MKHSHPISVFDSEPAAVTVHPTLTMTILSKCTIVFCGAMTVSAMGAAPTASDETPANTPSSYSALSPTARLGIAFSPPAKASESAAVAVPHIFPMGSSDPIAPDTVLLNPFYITGPRVKLTEKQTLTNKGRLALAEKQHITPLYRATFGPLSQLAAYYFDWTSILGGWHPNSREAMALYRQDERLKMLDEMDSLIRLETIHDSKETKQFRRIRFGADLLSR